MTRPVLMAYFLGAGLLILAGCARADQRESPTPTLAPTPSASPTQAPVPTATSTPNPAPTPTVIPRERSLVVTALRSEPYPEDEPFGQVRFSFFGVPFALDIGAVWKTNVRKRTIPIIDLYLAAAGKDGIPSIDDPSFVSVEDADEWLDDGEPVLFFEVEGDARAYPVQILLFHELVNDVVGGEPVLISY